MLLTVVWKEEGKEFEAVLRLVRRNHSFLWIGTGQAMLETRRMNNILPEIYCNNTVSCFYSSNSFATNPSPLPVLPIVHCVAGPVFLILVSIT